MEWKSPFTPNTNFGESDQKFRTLALINAPVKFSPPQKSGAYCRDNFAIKPLVV
ncbi:hypothetical protein D3C80_1217620 [compost metagenome]